MARHFGPLADQNFQRGQIFRGTIFQGQPNKLEDHTGVIRYELRTALLFGLKKTYDSKTVGK